MAGKINLTDQLKKYFGFDNFKGNQEPIIQNLLDGNDTFCLLYTSPSPRDLSTSRMPSSA